MITNLTVIIDAEKIKIQVPEIGFNEEICNLVAYDKVEKVPLAFGESQEQIQSYYDVDNWEKTKDQIGFEKLFTPETPKHDLENTFFEYCRGLIHQNEKGWLNNIRWFFLEKYDYNLWIPRYDEWTAQRRTQFEYALQIKYKANTLSINGSPHEIPIWKRNLEKWVRMLLPQYVPYVLCLVLLLIGVSTSKSVSFFLLAIILSILVEFVGKVIWMVSMRPILPTNYLQQFFPKLSFRFMTEKLAILLLKEPH